MMMRVSGKDLGWLAAKDACRRCYWLQRHAPDGLPFQVFPGIFSSIDSYSKKVIHNWFDREGSPPDWLGAIPDIETYVNPPHHSRFSYHDAAADVTLTGAPDGVLKLTNGGHAIIDYKTAKFTPAQDALLPVYEVQLNAYALIGEHRGLAPVRSLYLVYTEPVTDDGQRIAAACVPDGFNLSFTAHIHEIALDVDRIFALLREYRDLVTGPIPNISPSCKNCAKLQSLFNLSQKV